MRTLLTIKFLLFVSVIFGENAHACLLLYRDGQKITQFTMVSSPVEGRARSYTEGDGRSPMNQYVSINSCADGTTIAISRGLEVPKHEYPTRDVLAESRFYNPELCRVSNYPLNGDATIDRGIKLDQKFKVVDDCTRYRVTSDAVTISELSSQLRTQTDNEGKISCSFETVDSETILVDPKNLGLCMLPMKTSYKLNISFEVNPVCNSLSYFAQNKIELQEVRSSIRFDKQEVMDGNASKSSLGTLQGIFHFNPELQDGSSIANIPLINKPSRKQLEPRYMAVWPLEISLSKINIRNVEYEENGVQKREAMLQSIFLVDNRCETYCKNGICTSPCNYTQPAYASASFYKVNQGENRTRIARNWYTGGSAAPQWVGNISASFYRLNRNLQAGEVYEVEYRFADPKRTALRFLDFIKNSSEYLVEPMDISFNGDLSDLADLPEFATAEELETVLPLDDDLDSDIYREMSLGDKRFYPPVYKERWLGDRSSRPVNINAGKDRSNITVKVRFKVVGIQGNDYQLEAMKQVLSSTTDISSACQKMNGVMSSSNETSGKLVYTCEADFKEVNIRCN